MNICILGWYGTETMGDRAILDGIIKVFSKKFDTCNILIGSLCPCFTERTLLDDKDNYLLGCKNVFLSIFDEKDTNELYNSIELSDFVIMGGGPIMEINELYIIRKSFEYAKKKNIKTCLFGCGIGPLNSKRSIKVMKQILENTDLGIFRDSISKEYAEKCVPSKSFYYLPDPAIISILFYKEKIMQDIENKNEIVINYRKHPKIYTNSNNSINEMLVNIVKEISKKFDNVKLIPMHTFFQGEDDRIFLTEIKEKANCENVEVINRPMSLYNMYKIYSESKACIGMRYHSIVMQTILNGNNFVVDYTDPTVGKIISFLKDLDNNQFYTHRYYNYTTNKNFEINDLHILLNKQKFNYNVKYESLLLEYQKLLKEVL